MINSIGLQNPGVDKVIEEELAEAEQDVYDKKVMANVGGFSVEEYVAGQRRGWTRRDQVGWLEVNISCPNVHGTAESRFGTDPDAAASGGRAR